MQTTEQKREAEIRIAGKEACKTGNMATLAALLQSQARVPAAIRMTAP